MPRLGSKGHLWLRGKTYYAIWYRNGSRFCVNTHKSSEDESGAKDEMARLIRGEIPRLCRGGSRSLTHPAVCFTILAIELHRPGRCRTRSWFLPLIGCDLAPLRGQQP